MPQDIPERDGMSWLGRISMMIDRAIGALERVTLGLAVAALFAIMILIFLDGVLRYLANHPLAFVNDVVVLYLTSAAFLLVLSYTLRKGGHINVDVFAHYMSPRLQRLLSSVAMLCAVPVLTIMSIEMIRLSWDSYARGEVLVGLYAMPLWLSKAIVAVGLLILNLRVLHLGLFNFLSVVTGDEDAAIRIEMIADHPEEEMV